MSAATDAAILAAGGLVIAHAVRPPSRRMHASKQRPSDTVGGRRRRRQPSASAGEWATFLDIVSSEVRSGTSLASALQHASTRLPRLADQLRCATRGSDQERAIVVQSLAAAARLGGPVAATLHHGAALLREREAQRAEAKAHSAQARLSAMVLTAVPMIFAAWSVVTGASFRRVVLSTPGLAATAAGLLANAVGWWWMRRIIARAGP